MKKKSKYYVVWEGHNPGVYNSWEECKKQIQNYKGAKYKSFVSEQQAKVALTEEYKNHINSVQYMFNSVKEIIIICSEHVQQMFRNVENSLRA